MPQLQQCKILNPAWGSNPSHHRDNIWSLTCCATAKTPPAAFYSFQLALCSFKLVSYFIKRGKCFVINKMSDNSSFWSSYGFIPATGIFCLLFLTFLVSLYIYLFSTMCSMLLEFVALEEGAFSQGHSCLLLPGPGVITDFISLNQVQTLTLSEPFRWGKPWL